MEKEVNKEQFLALEKKHKRALQEIKKLKKRNVTCLGYERFRMYLDIDKVLKIMVQAKNEGLEIINLDGFKIPTDDIRYETFLKQTRCVDCGINASFIAIERNHYLKGAFHLNMYALKNGKEILMTRDHILPKSQGGTEHIDNMQTMCTDCNNRKGNKLRDKERGLITPNCYGAGT